MHLVPYLPSCGLGRRLTARFEQLTNRELTLPKLEVAGTWQSSLEEDSGHWSKHDRGCEICDTAASVRRPLKSDHRRYLSLETSILPDFWSLR